MNDLLGGSAASKSARYKADDDEGGDIEEGGPPPPPPTDGEQAMQRFFATVGELKADMASIRGLQREVVDLNEKGKTIVKTKEVQKHQEEMQVGLRQAGMGICMALERHASSCHALPGTSSGDPDLGAKEHGWVLGSMRLGRVA